MKSNLKHRIAASCIAFVATVGSLVGPTSRALADGGEVDTKNDARLECFPSDKNAAMKDSGTTLVWLIVCVLGVIGLGGLFMNAKRSHMD